MHTKRVVKKIAPSVVIAEVAKEVPGILHSNHLEQIGRADQDVVQAALDYLGLPLTAGVWLTKPLPGRDAWTPCTLSMTEVGKVIVLALFAAKRWEGDNLTDHQIEHETSDLAAHLLTSLVTSFDRELQQVSPATSIAESH